VTAERLGSYARATDGGTAAAFALYEWNMRAAASVMELTSMVEVIARNALDTQLRNWAPRKHGHPSWLDVVLLDQQGRKDARTFSMPEIERPIGDAGRKSTGASSPSFRWGSGDTWSSHAI
jgi:hypothetical protein